MQHICNQQKKIDEMTRIIEAQNRALFGDEFSGSMGAVQQIKEVHTLLVEGNAIKKFIVKSFSAVLAVAGLIYYVVSTNNRLKD